MKASDGARVAISEHHSRNDREGEVLEVGKGRRSMSDPPQSERPARGLANDLARYGRIGKAEGRL
jgi:hypothetical protein